MSVDPGGAFDPFRYESFQTVAATPVYSQTIQWTRPRPPLRYAFDETEHYGRCGHSAVWLETGTKLVECRRCRATWEWGRP